MDTERGRSEPVWRVLAVGWLAVQASDAGPGRGAEMHLEGPVAAFAQREHGLSPRALRSWPGIGETRALAVARARWEHPEDGPALYLGDVEGVGAATERAVRAWLGRTRAEP